MINIEQFLDKYYSPNETIILACSTGPDSMFLLYEILKDYSGIKTKTIDYNILLPLLNVDFENTIAI